jgi:hypothetical protein
LARGGVAVEYCRLGYLDDGAVSRNCKTTIEIVDTGHRMIWKGNYGQTGDVFTVYNHHIPESVWSTNP